MSVFRLLHKRTLFTSFFLVGGAIACSSSRSEPVESTSGAAQAVQAPALTSCEARDIAARGDSTYAIDKQGNVFGWGANDGETHYFALGHRPTDQSFGAKVTAPVNLGVVG